MRALNPELLRFYRNAFDPVLKEAAETQLAGNQDFSPIKMYCPYMPDESLLGPVQKDLLNKMVASGRKFVIKFFVSCIDGAREWDNASHFTIGRREDNQPVYIEIALLMLPEIYISRQLDEYFELNHGDSGAELFMRDVLGAKIYDELDEEFNGDYDLIDFDLLIKKDCPVDASIDDVLALFKEELDNMEENNADLLSLCEKIKQKVTAEKIAELTRDVTVPENAKGRIEALIDNGWSESLNGGQYGAFHLCE